jgi:beta-phosphoglucomutase-like phosphatase (HAD superfamily)
MKVLIFDMDVVLVDTMPFHYVAMKMAIKEVAYIDLDRRTFYLLEGMPFCCRNGIRNIQNHGMH